MIKWWILVIYTEHDNLYAGVGTYFLIVVRNFTHFFFFFGFIANLLSNIIACCWNLCSNPLLHLLMIVCVPFFSTSYHCRNLKWSYISSSSRAWKAKRGIHWCLSRIEVCLKRCSYWCHEKVYKYWTHDFILCIVLTRKVRCCWKI